MTEDYCHASIFLCLADKSLMGFLCRLHMTMDYHDIAAFSLYNLKILIGSFPIAVSGYRYYRQAHSLRYCLGIGQMVSCVDNHIDILKKIKYKLLSGSVLHQDRIFYIEVRHMYRNIEEISIL